MPVDAIHRQSPLRAELQAVRREKIPALLGNISRAHMDNLAVWGKFMDSPRMLSLNFALANYRGQSRRLGSRSF
jgi:hypothetical protein